MSKKKKPILIYGAEVISVDTGKVLNIKVGRCENLYDRITSFQCSTGESIRYNPLWTMMGITVKFEYYVHGHLKRRGHHIPSPKIAVNGKIYDHHKEVYRNHKYVRTLDIEFLYDEFLMFQNI